MRTPGVRRAGGAVITRFRVSNDPIKFTSPEEYSVSKPLLLSFFIRADSGLSSRPELLDIERSSDDFAQFFEGRYISRA
jgi:hypothetical protein